MYLFAALRTKKTGKHGLFFPPILCLCGYYAPYSHSLLFFSPVSSICLFFLSVLCSFVVDAVFFADLPILLPSVGLSLLLCVIIRLGVFRGSEAEKIGFCVVLVWCIYGKRADETFVCPIRPMSFACYFLCRNDVVLLCGLSVLTFPVTVGVMLS